MKKHILTLCILAVTTLSKAQPTNWTVDASHSNVKFSVTHLVVSEVEGSFKTYDGKVSSTSSDFNNAKVEFTVDVKSINTEDVNRDKHLLSDDFFNADKFPKMTFKSTSFNKVQGNNYQITGDLTIRDVTKAVTFEATYGGTVKDPWGNIKAGFKAKSKINRKDYKLMWNVLTEAGGMVVGDDVNILLNIELTQSK